jgi:outer membrane receptor protein involved in Fe transport
MEETMKKALVVSIGIVFLLIHIRATAEEKPENLGEIVVSGERLITPTKQTAETVYTGTEITKKGIEIQGPKADTSVYEAISILPDIIVESPDPLGLTPEQKNIRVRGVRGYFGALTVEGVPNYGGNPIGPRDYLYDTEDLQSIAVYEGAVPADLGTGVGGRAGAIELRPLWPKEKFSLDVSQGFGSNSYSRSFLRVDSGKLPKTGTRLSLSYSYTEADKWKGPGDLGPRNNLNLMVQQPIAGQDPIRFWFNFNDVKQDLYYPLTYAQTQDLDTNYRKDYNNNLTGIRSQDIYYFDYNRGDFTNMDVLAVIPWTFPDVLSLNFKPYYSYEDSYILNGVTSQGGVVQKRIRDLQRYGLISEVGSKFPFLKAALGYWVESSDLKIRTQNYDQWLPTAGIGYHLSDALEFYTSYGRTQIRPYSYLPLINLYSQNRAAFQSAGVTLNDLFNGYDMEISDNVELGARYRKNWLEIMPALFYARHQNLLTTVYDPRVNLSYQQNVGKATSYGAELDTSFYINNNFTYFLNGSYVRFTYDDDLTYQGATLNTKGNQVPDTPEWIVKTGLIFSYGGFQVVPMARYLGKRYGDPEHKEEIDDYIVVDLGIKYTKRNFYFIDALKVSLDFYNLLDKEYVSVINSSDDTRAGATSYLVGAPFAAVLTVSLEL